MAGGLLTIDLGALAANWEKLSAAAKPGNAAAVVKADAYGLGAGHAVPALVQAGCVQFFVANADEAVAIRSYAPDATIFVLEGAYADNLAALEKADGVPVLASMEQVEFWKQSRLAERACAIQIDTGMNRLGLTVSQAVVMREKLPQNVALFLSHFACADDIGHPLNKLQFDTFVSAISALPKTKTSISNSAATLWGGDFGQTIIRPGIAMYGGAAINDQPNTMKPVVTLKGRILQIRRAKKGQTVSYGASQTLERDTTIAVVGVGYADGYPRAASGAGIPLRAGKVGGAQGFVGGVRVPLLGRVTMDLTMFDVTDVDENALAEGWIELIGPNVSLAELASASGTIDYEILTSLGHRYERRYVNDG